MAAPSSPPADDKVREALAVTVCKSAHPGVQASCKPVATADPRHAIAACFSCQRVAAALMPAVSALVDKARADGLREFADALDAAADRSGEWPDAAEAYRWSADAARYHARRPAALAAIRQTEGNNR